MALVTDFVPFRPRVILMAAYVKELHINPHSVILSEQKHVLFHFCRKPTLCALLLLVSLSFFSLVSCKRENAEEKYNRLMTSAEQYQKEQKWNEARIQIQAAIDSKPESAEAYYRLAEVLIRLQNIKRAIELYNTALNYDPMHQKARLHLAAILLAAKQYELAESHIRKLLEQDPKDIDASVLRANLEANGPRKNLDLGRSILTEVLVRQPENVPALATLAQIDLNQGDVREAEEHLSKAAALEPNNSTLQVALADLFAREGRLDEAQSVMEKLVAQNPAETGLRYIFGEFLLRRGLTDEALSQYQETVKADAKRYDARDRLYDMYLVRGEFEKAKNLTADLEKAQPGDPAVLYFKGRDLELAGKEQEALSNFLEAMKSISSFGPLFRHAGLIELKTGQEREGLEHLNQAIGIDAGDVGARLALARNFFAHRDFAQAKEHLNQILSRYPTQLGANIVSADIALIEGDTDKARSVYEYLVKAFPKEPSGYFKMGLLEERNKNFEESANWFRKALDLDVNILGPARRFVLVEGMQKKGIDGIINELQAFRNKSKASKAEYDFIIGSLYLAKREDPQRVTKAREYLNRALEEKQDLVGAYFALAAADAETKDFNAAIQNYKKLLEKNPRHLPTMMLLSYAYEQQGKFDQAADEYREILKTAPRFAPAANNLAWLLADRLHGDLDEALRLAEIAKEQLPKEPSVADTLGWIYYLRGAPRAALPHLREALELYEQIGADNRAPNPEILYHLAEVQSALNNKEQAKEAIKKALAIAGSKHPKFEQMEKLRQKLG